MSKEIGAIIIIENGEGMEIDRTVIYCDESKTKVRSQVSRWIDETLSDILCWSEDFRRVRSR